MSAAVKGLVAFKLRALTGFLALTSCVAGLSAAFLAAAPFPELDSFVGQGFSSRILDRRGGLMAVIGASGSPGIPGAPGITGAQGMPGGMKREHSALSELSFEAIRIFTGSEDRRFFLHPGIDPLAGARSLFLNLTAGKTVSGASTITMQLARLVMPGRRGLAGKIADSIDALRIEARLSKNRILELYLDSVPFGSTILGVSSASRHYFGKPIRLLSPAELCLLAVIPRSPVRNNPSVNPEAAGRAAARLAASLRLSGIPAIDTSAERFERLARASAEQARTASDYSYTSSGAPHFIRYWFSGDSPIAGFRMPEVRSSIDPAIQARLLSSIRKGIAENREFRMTNGAGLVVDNWTGEILAWAGSGDFDDDAAKGQIDGVRTPGQPGSCLKPFLYALAIDQGYTPATILADSPADFGSEEAYVPLNFNNRFNGPVRLRVALASSLNVPAVQTLEQVGTSHFIRFLTSLGFSTMEGMEENAGLGLALGNVPVSLYELVRAFSVFPRGGFYGELTPLASRRPTLSSARTSSRETQPSTAFPYSATSATRIMSPYSAGIVRDILSDQPSRFAGFAHGKLLSREYDAMFKTGTANQFQHVWALGATPDYTIGVWMGNFTGETVIGKRSSGVPAAVLIEVLDAIAKPGSRFPPVPDSIKIEICAASGFAATVSCPGTLVELLPQRALSPRAPSLPLCAMHPGTRKIAYGSGISSSMATGALETGAPETGAAASGIEVSELTTPAGTSTNTSKLSTSKLGASRLGASRLSLRFVHPRDGAIFYFDPSFPSKDQAIGIRLEGLEMTGTDETILLRVDSEDPVPIQRDGRPVIPLVRGEHRLALIVGGIERASARYSVR